MDSIKQTIKNG